SRRRESSRCPDLLPRHLSRARAPARRDRRRPGSTARPSRRPQGPVLAAPTPLSRCRAGVSLISGLRGGGSIGGAGPSSMPVVSPSWRKSLGGGMQALSLEFKLHQLGDAPALLPASVGKPIGLLVLLAFVSEGIWRLARHISVIAHEGAHALAGRSMGRKVVGVRLNSDATGETASQGPAVGPGRIITAFAGYLGPSVFGLGEAAL